MTTGTSTRRSGPVTIETTFARSSDKSPELADAAARTVRKWGLWLFLGGAFFALYGSLVPFNFQFSEGPSLWQQIGDVPTKLSNQVGRVDFFSNVCLFVPIALGGMAWLSRPKWTPLSLLSMPVVILLAVGISVCCEGGQAFLPGRIASRYDLLAHFCGTVLGCLLWLAGGSLIRKWVANVHRHPQARHRVDQILVGYFLFHFVNSLFPLDVTIHPVDLFQKFRGGQINIVPFAGLQWNADLAAEMLFYGFTSIPLGALATRLWMPQGKLRNIPDGIALGVGIVVGIEVCQLFVLSRYTDATQIVMGTLGVSLGVLAMHLAWPYKAAGESKQAWFTRPGTWILCALCYAVVPAFFLLWPFEFVFDTPAIKRGLDEMFRLPLASLLRSPPLQISTVLLRDILLFFPLGLLWGAGIRRCRPEWKVPVTVLAWCAITVTIVGIELLQLVIPERVADVTNILIGVGAAFIGMMCLSRHSAPSRVNP